MIKDLTLDNTEITKILELDKASRLYVKAVSDDGTNIDIEIQCRNTGEIPSRAFHYLSAMVKNSVKEGESYNKTKVISIWILGENVTDRISAISDAYMTFQENDKDPYQVMTDQARIIFLELNKFKPKTDCQQDMLNAWVSFLKDPIYLDDATLEISEIKDAMETLKYISSDDETRAIADLRKKTINDHNSELTVAREEGLEEGISIGVEEERKKNAINMKADGLANSTIAKYLNISESEIEELLK